MGDLHKVPIEVHCDLFELLKKIVGLDIQFCERASLYICQRRGIQIEKHIRNGSVVSYFANRGERTKAEEMDISIF